mmetsp:Transcript_34004/g.52983  ORF Transcript_34004/g.52983 Transcript_34004/m.52983 type:complete len:92 (+) Transcript_34004:435-710(+)
MSLRPSTRRPHRAPGVPRCSVPAPGHITAADFTLWSAGLEQPESTAGNLELKRGQRIPRKNIHEMNTNSKLCEEFLIQDFDLLTADSSEAS